MLLDRVRDRNIRIVYLTILLLGVSYGLAISLVGVWLEELGFAKEKIGTLAIFFATGIVVNAVPAGYFIRRFSARAVLVTCLLGYAACVAAFPFVRSYEAVGLLRLGDGAFSVGVWVSSETILLERAPREDKGYFTSLYAISLALGYVLGSLGTWALAPALGKTACFVIGGGVAVAAASVVAVALDHRGPPHLDEEVDASGVPSAPSTSSPRLSTGALFWRIKTSCFATFAYGYFQASVVLFLPLYLIERGITEKQTMLITAYFAAGMLLFSNLMARLGDRFGHLAVMRVCGVVGTAAILSFLFAGHVAVVYALIFVAGASLASVSPVSLALQGLVVPPRDLSRAGGLYNASYAAGMLGGPPIAGLLFGRWGGGPMLVHFAVLWTVFVAVTVVFRRDDPRLAAATA